ncbi:metal ABC transporter permease [Paenibacillus silvae]|nr:metal ABC transporter permease [Paenibacillus silvae]MCK6076304.1 metal ABC transporter permease [Paenibacillus silvae]MCK6078341.1 metal ABC transporter permease [Paenibacillus silvae]MCK6150537.1 metal ABC transporter permease [Paenibacillus silvae]MCK6268797.1 metal ABC transporter permease [Paenibacillus silvae]MCK6270390.1 metal ABC transporter permease [Paenibacillus silvae]
MGNWLLSILSDPNTRWILLGCILLGFSSGIIGSFTFLRRQSLMGDTLAHAALPGICIAFMLTETKSIGWFLLGALVAGIVATFGISWITRFSRIKQDTAMGIVLTVFFGIGVVMLTRIQHSASGSQSGLDKYLFGQAASMVQTDVYVMGGVCLVLLIACLVWFKEFKLVSFDPGFARGMGLPVGALEQFILLLTVIAVVAGIQAVGVVLVAALLVTPAAAARCWTDSLALMVLLAGLFGALSGAAGTLFSTLVPNLPTGPVTVLAATVLFAGSALLAPRRGLLARKLRSIQARSEYLREEHASLQTLSAQGKMQERGEM